MPEQGHFFFERAPGISHSGEPPSLKLASIEPRKVERVRKIKTAPQQVVHRAIVDLFIVDQKVDRALPPAGSNVVDFVRAPAKAHSSQEVSGFIVCDTHHLSGLLTNLREGQPHRASELLATSISRMRSQVI